VRDCTIWAGEEATSIIQGSRTPVFPKSFKNIKKESNPGPKVLFLNRMERPKNADIAGENGLNGEPDAV
jgi:hypothetical protein